MFKWVCLGIASVMGLWLCWVANDIRLQIHQTSDVVNQHLPVILENTNTSTETMTALAEDIRQLRDLAGVAQVPRDRTMAAYADSLLDLIEKTDGQIGLTKKVFGTGLKGLVPTREWVVSSRKEALWQTFRAQSKQELLTRLCTNKYGSQWIIVPTGKPAQSLLEWLQTYHLPTRKITSP